VTGVRLLRFLGWLVAVPVVALMGIWLVQDNSTPVPLALLGFPVGSLPLGIWLLLAFLLGVLAAMLASFPVLVRLRLRERRRQRSPTARSRDPGAAHHP
jgi:uncharacterized integral membrane protein